LPEKREVNRIANLPSWVPDYFQDPDWTSRYLSESMYDTSVLGKTRPEFSIVTTDAPGRPLLRLRGKLLSEVKLKGEALMELTHEDVVKEAAVQLLFPLFSATTCCE
jgi:hypothetical protein